MINFDNFKVEKCPSTAYYLPNFITEEEENVLLKHIYQAPKPKWTQLKSRHNSNLF